jgi:hypothetical protein
LNPYPLGGLDPKSSASANSATLAFEFHGLYSHHASKKSTLIILFSFKQNELIMPFASASVIDYVFLCKGNVLFPHPVEFAETNIWVFSNSEKTGN